MRQTIAAFGLCAATLCAAQDSSTGAIRGLVRDAAGKPAAAASVSIRDSATNATRLALTDSDGRFAADLLPPGDYIVTVTYLKFVPRELSVHVDAAQPTEVSIDLVLRTEAVKVTAETPMVETQSSSVATVIPEQAIQDLPLNGRRFSDLALLGAGVTQDPRSLTSSSNGDLAYGGLRGYHTQFLVDGSDNNNAFFAQMRGRYRAPYQFSNEVVQEFTVSTNSYGAELAGAGGAVVNVVTKSGSNYFHGSAFYYMRDSTFDARPPFVSFKPSDRQQQFGFTVGGPIRRNKAFFFAGYDQHVFRVPQVVEFLNGSTQLTPVPTNGRIPGDYEASDKALVLATVARLETQAGEFRSALLGDAGFAKVDIQLTPKQSLAIRLSTSRYYGENNVFFDPASPVTNFTVSNNGEENVETESLNASLTSALTPRVTSHLRAQISRDLQESSANSALAGERIDLVLNGLQRSDILPRHTNEKRFHLAETVSVTGKRSNWKFGGELGLVWINNFFPSFFGGQYIFDAIKVNPFTFVPQVGGLELTPLRAYAHEVPKFYEQNFGSAVSHPDTHTYSAYAQDAIRVTGHLALNLGVRYDLQTFRSQGLTGTPLWPQAGKVPFNGHNLAPRMGFAYSMGEDKPLVIRGGYGLFYALIPQIYNSAVETQNGINDQHLFLNNSTFADRQIFPAFPDALVNCPPAAESCAAPADTTGHLSADVSAFAHDFQTPYAQQANLSVERQVTREMAVEANYLFVHGTHLIRARDVNLPPPVILNYPVFDDSGTNFLGTFYQVASFASWQFTPSLTCPFPPCINPLQRPIARLGAINSFESESSSTYSGFTLSLKRRASNGLYFRVAYTLAHAIDDNQDALVAGQPAQVQNSYAPKAERGPGVADQRSRFVASWSWQPHWFHREHPALGEAFNGWTLAGIVTVGSGRPFSARVIGDANQDGNSDNDRLPGAARNSFLGPDYASTDLRLSRMLHLSDKLRLQVLVESFNLFNRDNQRVDITDNGFEDTASNFVQLTRQVNGKLYPAHFRTVESFLKPTSAYAPRQIQFSARIKF